VGVEHGFSAFELSTQRGLECFRVAPSSRHSCNSNVRAAEMKPTTAEARSAMTADHCTVVDLVLASGRALER